jgi:hypothetical protein
MPINFRIICINPKGIENYDKAIVSTAMLKVRAAKCRSFFELGKIIWPQKTIEMPSPLKSKPN